MATLSSKLIDQISSRINTDTGLIELSPIIYNAGDKVRVVDGALAGLEGIFKQTNSENRVILLMNLLGTQTKVQVQSQQVELVT